MPCTTKITLKMLIEDFNKIHGFDHYDYSLITEYVNAKTKLKIRCIKHNNIFFMDANQHKSKRGCKICGIERLKKQLGFTDDEIDKKLKENDIPIRRMESMLNKTTRDSMKWQCLNIQCKWEWESNIGNVINNKSPCPVCFNCGKMTNEYVDHMLKIQNRSEIIERVDNVVKSSKTMNWKCKICEWFWKANPNNIINKKSNCPKCNGGIRYTNSEFLKQSKEIHGDSFEYFDEYVTSNVKMKIKHLKCGTIFYQTPYKHVYRKQGCPKCNLPHGEREIKKFMEKYELKFHDKIGYISFNDCRNPLTNYKLKFDFCVYDDFNNIRCLIEFDGPDHFLPMELQSKTNPKRYNMEQYMYNKFKDIIKDRYCDFKGIKLIRIPYWELENIEDILIKEISLF